MSSLGELVEKLTIANIKLYNLCDRKALAANNPGDFSKEELAAIMRKDIELCKERALLKNAINKVAGIPSTEEIKSYGEG